MLVELIAAVTNTVMLFAKLSAQSIKTTTQSAPIFVRARVTQDFLMRIYQRNLGRLLACLSHQNVRLLGG